MLLRRAAHGSDAFSGFSEVCVWSRRMRFHFSCLVAAALINFCSANVRTEGMRHLMEHRYEENPVFSKLAAQPPLVTAKSIQEAQAMHLGAPVGAIPIQYVPVQAMAAQYRPAFKTPPKATILADDKPSAFAGIPPWVFILTFLGSVAVIILMFYLTERMWAKRQENPQ